jgi:hypothetical protein
MPILLLISAMFMFSYCSKSTEPKKTTPLDKPEYMMKCKVVNFSTETPMYRCHNKYDSCYFKNGLMNCVPLRKIK